MCPYHNSVSKSDLKSLRFSLFNTVVLYQSLLCCCDETPKPDTATYSRKGLFTVQRVRVHCPWRQGNIVASGRHGSWNRKLRSHIPNHKLKGEREWTKGSTESKLSNPPQWHTSSSKAMLKPLQTMPPTGNQVFRYSSLWGISPIQNRTRLCLLPDGCHDLTAVQHRPLPVQQFAFAGYHRFCKFWPGFCKGEINPASPLRLSQADRRYEEWLPEDTFYCVQKAKLLMSPFMAFPPLISFSVCEWMNTPWNLPKAIS